MTCTLYRWWHTTTCSEFHYHVPPVTHLAASQQEMESKNNDSTLTVQIHYIACVDWNTLLTTLVLEAISIHYIPNGKKKNL